MLRLSSSTVLLIGALGGLWGCMKGDSKRCHIDAVIDCECDDGSPGVAYCGTDRRPTECYCDDYVSPSWDASVSSGRDASSWPSYDASFAFDAASADASAGPSDGTLLRKGTATLLNVFTLDKDVWVVDREGVARVSLEDGTVRTTWSAPRPLTAALFDGVRLITLDGAKLTVLGATDLELLADRNLVEPCTSSTLLSDGRVVCGAGASGGTRSFYVFDAITGAAIGGASANPNYNDGALKAIPGSSRFVATASSPRLYSVNTAGMVAPVGMYNASSISDVNAFDGEPAQNIVNSSGALYRIDETCDAVTPSACLARSGTLGTTLSPQAYLAMDNVGSRLFALSNGGSSGSSFEAVCASQAPCRIEVIDVPSRLVEATQPVVLSCRKALVMRATRDGSSLVIGYDLLSADRFTNLTGNDFDYQVSRIDLQTDAGSDAGSDAGI